MKGRGLSSPHFFVYKEHFISFPSLLFEWIQANLLSALLTSFQTDLYFNKPDKIS